MELFRSGNRNILAVNNEFVNLGVLYGNRSMARPVRADDIRKGKAAHDVSVIEIAERDGKWGVVLDSPLNRRITADTPVEVMPC